jgi:hypothetical protein
MISEIPRHGQKSTHYLHIRLLRSSIYSPRRRIRPKTVSDAADTMSCSAKDRFKFKLPFSCMTKRLIEITAIQTRFPQPARNLPRRAGLKIGL